MTPSSNDHATTRPSDYVTTRLRDADHATKSIFFSGKGGVGKTSMACATAVRFADEGKRTLIVTTDPASNLADVFEQSIGHQITPIKDVPNLWAMEIDPDRARRNTWTAPSPPSAPPSRRRSCR
jgi:anion-transporting  ArsA/GET3 family ATPase